MPRVFRAFVSSTYEDLKEHRAFVIEALRDIGISVDPMENWQASSDEPRTFSVRRMQGCDLCILLVAYRRGIIPDGETDSITQLEYRYASAKNIPVLPFVLGPKTQWFREFDERGKDPGVDAWRAEIGAKRGVSFFGREPYSIPIAATVARWIREREDAGSDNVEDVLAEVLQPLSFVADIEESSGRFVGRRWIFDRIEQWLSDPDASRLFWITGAPGIGKTAIATSLCGRLAEVKAFHFCRYGDSAKADPRRCVMSVAYQLSRYLDEYGRRLRELALRSFIEQSNAETLFDRLIVQPLWQKFPHPDGSIILLIDALDEATKLGRNELAEFLGAQFAKTPAWLRLIVTSRSESEVMVPLAAFDPVELDAASVENINDLRAYVAEEAPKLIASGTMDANAIEILLARSEGSFLYVRRVCDELAAGRLSLDRPLEFPTGLGGVYQEFFHRRFPDPQSYRSSIRPALQVIAAAQEALPVMLLAELFRWSEQDAADFHQAVGSLFPQRNGCAQPFHRSVTEWLTNQTRAGSWFVSEKDGHRALAELGWRLFEADTATAYFERHLPEHLTRIQSWQRLEQLLSSPRQLRRAWSTGSIYDWMHYWRPLDSGANAGTRFNAALDALEASGADSGDLAMLSDQMGWFLGEMELFSDARRIAARGLEWRRVVIGDRHPDFASSLYGLAELCRRDHDFEAARPLYEQALAIRREVNNAAAVAATLHGLGEFFHDQHLHEDARRCYEECLGICEEALPADDPATGNCLNDLGVLYYETGDAEAALPLYQRAERILRVVYGPRHPEFAAVEFCQARIYQERGDLARAWSLFLRALEVHERVYPVNHDKVMKCREAFFSILPLLDDASRAVALERLLEARERAYGFEHEITAATFESLAWHFIQSNPNRAVERARRAVERRIASNGPDDITTATALNTLVRCLQMARCFEEAVPFALRALEIRKRRTDVLPQDLAVSYNNLGLLLVELGRFEDAEVELKRCLAVDAEAPNAHYWLGRLYEARSQPKLEMASWQSFLQRNPKDKERKTYAERRLEVLGI